MKKILLIEDEQPYREILADTIKDSGLMVLEAQNGKIGLEILEKNKADLILLDLLMPVMDGRVFLQHFLKSEHKQTPVIVLTNISDPNLPEEIPFIMKVNTNLEDLMKIIERRLGE